MDLKVLKDHLFAFQNRLKILLEMSFIELIKTEGITSNYEEATRSCNTGLSQPPYSSVSSNVGGFGYVKVVYFVDYYDYNKLVKPLIDENQPAYILFRLDTKSPDSGYDWLFISWSPDNAPVRQKMLYASTKATLKQEFGTASIKDELHGTVMEDVTLEGYNRHKKNDAAPAPLTSAEEELVELKKTAVHTDYNVETRHQTLSGVAFPVTDEAKQAITNMGKGVHEYVQLKIDLDEEKIHLVMTVFIYSMPGYSCSIKERMLYSSCKAPLLDLIQSLGVTIAKKLEVNSGEELADMLEDPPTIKEKIIVSTPVTPTSNIPQLEIDDAKELTEGFLQEELHPKVNLHRPKFAKPKGPPGRGAKRITKVQDLDKQEES
ncbi:hypothetical protein G9C98_000468 [Cotesia typhae]|uniref:ADF-H domain-containing protein n=1 Tax=Cotesia typhae TaxID=2053667 RepID=A0A8J5VBP9_9HYME|nr:hypothetical protein G9C98_000468 [Cotesia typhae]